MHKGVKHTKVMEGYQDFARSEGAEAKKYVDSIRKNDPFAEGLDDVMDEESRRRERNFYVKGTTVSKEKTVDTPALRTESWYERKEDRHDNLVEKGKDEKAKALKDRINKSREFDAAKAKHKSNQTKPIKSYGDNMFTTPVTRSPLGMMKNASPFQMSCWKGYEAQGQKPSPSGKKTSGGQIKMVNNCVKK